MEETAATTIVHRADGTEALLLRRLRLSVKRGPDKGKELLVEQTRVRIGTAADCELRLTDPAVSRYHVELMATDEGYRLRDLRSTNGTLQGDLRLVEALVGKPVTVRVGEKTMLHLAPTRDEVEIPISARGQFGGLLGQSRSMRQLFALLERIAPSRSTVLLEGESGTGKEVAAEAIHQASDRRDGPFIVVDCGAIPASLIESELFGHEKGAFTGAAESRAGALEQADGGTLFLDEVGELPLELQPRLLRFLESQQIKRVGGTQHRKLDIRVVAATNRRVAVEVEEGRFRQDLYYRLSVMRVEMPPLRDRPEDVVLLANTFAETFAKDPRTIITDEMVGLLMGYDWPGNVRELRNTVERLALFPEMAAEALEDAARTGQPPSIGTLANEPFHEARRRWQDLFERQYLVTQLTRASGVVTQAATAAGIPRQTFNRMLRRHGLGKG